MTLLITYLPILLILAFNLAVIVGVVLFIRAMVLRSQRHRDRMEELMERLVAAAEKKAAP